MNLYNEKYLGLIKAIGNAVDLFENKYKDDNSVEVIKGIKHNWISITLRDTVNNVTLYKQAYTFLGRLWVVSPINAPISSNKFVQELTDAIELIRESYIVPLYFCNEVSDILAAVSTRLFKVMSKHHTDSNRSWDIEYHIGKDNMGINIIVKGGDSDYLTNAITFKWSDRRDLDSLVVNVDDEYINNITSEHRSKLLEIRDSLLALEEA